MKHKVALILSTITLAVSGLTGCHRKRTVINPSIKNAFQYTEEKVDEYNNTFSASTHIKDRKLAVRKALDEEDSTDTLTSVEESLDEVTSVEESIEDLTSEDESSEDVTSEEETTESVEDSIQTISSEEEEEEEELPEEEALPSETSTTNYNTSITEAKLFEFLTAEFFGIYVYSCVNYNLQNKYETYGLKFDDPIYGDVTNVIDPYGREALDKANATNTFYYEMSQEGNDLLFKCDWDLTPSKKELSERFEGTIYVNGRIYRDDELNVKSYSLTSFKCSNGNSNSVLTGIRFDFIHKKLYVVDGNIVDASEGNANNIELISKYNAGKLDFKAFREAKFSTFLVGSANLTDDYRDIDYKGYFWKSSARGKEKIILNAHQGKEEEFHAMYREVYSKLYKFDVRVKGDDLSRSGRTKVKFLEDSLGFGVAKSRIYVGANNEVDYVFIEKEKLIEEINKYVEAHEGDDTLELLNTLRSEVESIDDDEYLTYFSNKTYEFDANVASYYRHTTYNATDFYYKFTNKKNKERIKIGMLNGEITDVVFEAPHGGDGYEKYSEAGSNKTNSKVSYKENDDGSVVLTETLNCYNTCDECGEQYIWKSEVTTYLGTFDKSNKLFQYAEYYNVGNKAFYGFKTSYRLYRYNYEQYDLVNVINEQYGYEYLSAYNVYYPTSILRKSVDAIYYGGTDYTRTNIDCTYITTIEETEDTTVIKCSVNQYIDEVMWRQSFESTIKSLDATITVKRNERYNYDVSLSFKCSGGSTSEYEGSAYTIESKYSFTSHLEYKDYEDDEHDYPYVCRQIFEDSYDRKGDITAVYDYTDNDHEFFKFTEHSYYNNGHGRIDIYDADEGYGMFKKDGLLIPLCLPFYNGQNGTGATCDVWSDYYFIDALLDGVVRTYVQNDMPVKETIAGDTLEQA